MNRNQGGTALAEPAIDPRRTKFMPLKLKAILVERGLRQTDMCNAVFQFNGRPLSKSAAGMLTNWGQWPKQTPRHSIVQQTVEWLISQGVRPEVAAVAFELDDEASVHEGPVIGAPHRYPQKPEKDPTHIEPEMLTAAAKKQFALFRDPFIDDVQGPDDLFLSADQRYVREAMFQAAKQGGWLMAVVGESGSGKSTLRRETLDRIHRERLPVVAIQARNFDKTTLNASHICEAILADLNPSIKPGRSLEGIARQVERSLIDSGRAGQSHVLIIEEAHDLPIQTLKYLKRFWEMEDGFKKLLSIMLVGQPELRNKLDERRYPDARELIRRCEVVELAPLDSNLGEYLELKFRRIGRDVSELIDANAIDAMRQRLLQVGRGPSRGEAISMCYPLVVNNLVTTALNVAASLGAPKVTADIVRGA
ncbi:MAG: ExeA family protein [Proteobacteria bacterium]|nr:ExeA family protein [Pseudomonadota bacterium]